MAGRMKKPKNNKNNKNKGIHPLMRILISIILLFVLWQSVQVLVLSFAGETTLGVITGYDSRVDDRQAQPNRSRTISQSYSFTVSGKEYKGYVIYGSDEAWPRLKEGEVRAERISYLASFPYINKPAMLVDIDKIGPAGLLYHIMVIPGCTFLLLMVNGRILKRKKRLPKRIKQKRKTKGGMRRCSAKTVG
jgi:hypothetical protein